MAVEIVNVIQLAGRKRASDRPKKGNNTKYSNLSQSSQHKSFYIVEVWVINRIDGRLLNYPCQMGLKSGGIRVSVWLLKVQVMGD
jgi:hypothetical protein